MHLEQLLARLRQETALNLDASGVERAVRQRLRLLRSDDREAYLRQALAQRDTRELAALIDLLVVPETWFFRDPAVFSAAARLVGERVARDARPVRILSLPCSTGEEPYTIAMALLDAGVAPAAFAIDAIDLSHAAIDHARRGLYRRYAFRSQDLGFRDRYFARDGEAYALRADVRASVHFSQGNLLGGKSGAPYDLVFCRNLLIYFDEPTRQRALRELDRLLAPDGWLFTAYAELAACGNEMFEMQSIHDVYALTRATASRPGIGPGLPRRREPAPPPSPPPAARRRTAASGAAARPPRPATAVSPEQARRLADRGDIEAAARAYAALLEAHPDSSEAAFMLALLSERQARPEFAETCFKRTVYLDPDHYEALCHLALLAERRGDAVAGAAYRRRAARVYRRRAPGALTG